MLETYCSSRLACERHGGRGRVVCGCVWALTGVLADADDEKAERQQGEDPAETDGYAPVDLGPVEAPGAGEDVAQRLDGVRLRQKVGDVAQVDGHALHRPQHAAQQQVRVETAHRQVDGARLLVAQTRHQESVRHAAHALEQRDEDGRSLAAVARDGEDDQHEDEDERRLADQHRKLVGQMGDHDLGRRHAGHQTAVQQALLALVDEHGRRQGHRDKVHDGQNQAGRHELGEGRVLVAEDGVEELRVQRKTVERHHWSRSGECQAYEAALTVRGMPPALGS